MSKKTWGSILIILGLIMLGLGGYAMEEWQKAVDMGESMGITESMLEEALDMPGMADYMGMAVENGKFGFYLLKYRMALCIGGLITLIVGIVVNRQKDPEPAKPWAEQPPRVQTPPAPAPKPAAPSGTTPVRNVQAPAPQPAGESRTLQGVDGALAGRTFKLSAKTVIGRSNSRCQIIFPAETKGVSGVHCTVRFNGSTVTVTDENSSYGTFLDGVRLTPGHATTMHRGQLLQLGSKKECLKLRN